MVTIDNVKTRSSVLVFAESLPLAVRQVDGDGGRNRFTFYEIVYKSGRAFARQLRWNRAKFCVLKLSF